jgi:putative transposase
MSHNYYAEINLHFVWHTKQSQPFLSPDLEKVAHGSIRARALAVCGLYFHEVGGTETHVHVAVSIPPTLLVSEFVGRLKGGSSHEVNQVMGPGRLQWQNGYGVVSFGTRDLEWVKAYIRNQKQHHAIGRVFERLERITEMEPAGDEDPCSSTGLHAEAR